jgi:hypothetical protein
MGLFDFLPGKEKAVTAPTNRPAAGPSTGADADAPPAYHAVTAGPEIRSSVRTFAAKDF